MSCFIASTSITALVSGSASGWKPLAQLRFWDTTGCQKSQDMSMSSCLNLVGPLVKACQEVLQLDCNHFYPQLDKHGNPVQISSEDRNESPLFHLECFTLSVESPMCPDLRWVSNFTLCHFIKYWLVQNGFASSWSMIPSGKLT